MPTIGSHQVYVSVDGHSLDEYDVKVAPPAPDAPYAGTLVTCWIPSELGKVSLNIFKITFYDVT